MGAETSVYDAGVKVLGGEMGPELQLLMVECKWKNLSRMYPLGGSRGYTAVTRELSDLKSRISVCVSGGKDSWLSAVGLIIGRLGSQQRAFSMMG